MNARGRGTGARGRATSHRRRVVQPGEGASRASPRRPDGEVLCTYTARHLSRGPTTPSAWCCFPACSRWAGPEVSTPRNANLTSTVGAAPGIALSLRRTFAVKAGRNGTRLRTLGLNRPVRGEKGARGRQQLGGNDEAGRRLRLNFFSSADPILRRHSPSPCSSFPRRIFSHPLERRLPSSDRNFSPTDRPTDRPRTSDRSGHKNKARSLPRDASNLRHSLRTPPLFRKRVSEVPAVTCTLKRARPANHYKCRNH